MYVCPSCSEEIPDRVKKTAEECPFCHTAWPAEEEEPEGPVEPAKPEGWGNEFKPSPAGVPSAGGAAQEEKKSKVGLIVALLVVVLGGGGAGYYFGVVRGKGDKSAKKGGKASSGPSEEEFSAMQTWYNEAHKIIQDYVATDCLAYHNAGYTYHSKLVPVKSFADRRGKRVETIEFKLELQAAGKGQGAPKIFECPYKIALIHRDHPYVLEAKIWERKEVFGAVLNYADIEVKGKLTGYLVGKDGKPQTKFRSLASQTLDGFSFPALKNAPDPGLAALGKELPFKASAKTFTLGNLTWQKTAPGKYLIGTWELRLTTEELKRNFENWASACESIRRQKFAKLNAPQAGHQAHDTMYKAGRDVMRELCESMEKLKGALEPWNEAAATEANTKLQNAQKKWNAEVYNVLVDTGKKTQNTVRATPF